MPPDAAVADAVELVNRLLERKRPAPTGDTHVDWCSDAAYDVETPRLIAEIMAAAAG